VAEHTLAPLSAIFSSARCPLPAANDGGRLVPLYFSDVDQSHDLVQYLQSTRRPAIGKGRLLERQVGNLRTPHHDFPALKVAPVAGSDPPRRQSPIRPNDQETGRIMPARAS